MSHSPWAFLPEKHREYKAKRCSKSQTNPFRACGRCLTRDAWLRAPSGASCTGGTETTAASFHQLQLKPGCGSGSFPPRWRGETWISQPFRAQRGNPRPWGMWGMRRWHRQEPACAHHRPAGTHPGPSAHPCPVSTEPLPPSHPSFLGGGQGLSSPNHDRSAPPDPLSPPRLQRLKGGPRGRRAPGGAGRAAGLSRAAAGLAQACSAGLPPEEGARAPGCSPRPP